MSLCLSEKENLSPQIERNHKLKKKTCAHSGDPKLFYEKGECSHKYV